MWQILLAQIVLERHMNEEDINTEEYAIFSPINLSATRVFFEYKNKTLIEFASCRFASAKVRLLSQHTHEDGTLQRYMVEIVGN